jgi:hypothetical protein
MSDTELNTSQDIKKAALTLEELSRRGVDTESSVERESSRNIGLRTWGIENGNRFCQLLLVVMVSHINLGHRRRRGRATDQAPRVALRSRRSP